MFFSLEESFTDCWSVMTPSLEASYNFLDTLTSQHFQSQGTDVTFYKIIVIALVLLFMYQSKYNFTQMFSMTVS